MKLSTGSGSKPQSVEDGIGSGPFRLAPDPLLHSGQSLGGLVDVVAIDVDERFEQQFDAFAACAGGSRHIGAAPRHTAYGSHSAELCHLTAFPRNIPAMTAEPGPAFFVQPCRAGA
jgi:hypothetical protein